MPKIKTHKSLSKRIKKTKSGKLLRASAYDSHLQTKRTTNCRKRHQGYKKISDADKKKIKKLI
jgi:large subunit ribosomal protein L35